MAASSETGQASGWAAPLGRGCALFAGLGGVLAGIAATIGWPVVGTFFGAVEGALAGAALGALAAAALTILARWTRSRWAARGVSGAMAAAAAVGAVLIHAGPAGLPRAVAVVLIVAGVALAAALGPLIAYGMEPVPGGWLTAARLPRVLGRFLALGAGLGGAAGAVAGLIIGIRSYLPTSPFALVEGAVFGAVSGVVLACLAVGVAVLPRLRARQ